MKGKIVPPAKAGGTEVFQKSKKQSKYSLVYARVRAFILGYQKTKRRQDGKKRKTERYHNGNY